MFSLPSFRFTYQRSSSSQYDDHQKSTPILNSRSRSPWSRSQLSRKRKLRKSFQTRSRSRPPRTLTPSHLSYPERQPIRWRCWWCWLQAKHIKTYENTTHELVQVMTKAWRKALSKHNLANLVRRFFRHVFDWQNSMKRSSLYGVRDDLFTYCWKIFLWKAIFMSRKNNV